MAHGHARGGAEVGNGRAVASSAAMTCAGVSVGCTETISATVPATSGAEKLVPTEAWKLSLNTGAPGAVVPALLVVRIGTGTGRRRSR